MSSFHTNRQIHKKPRTSDYDDQRTHRSYHRNEDTADLLLYPVRQSSPSRALATTSTSKTSMSHSGRSPSTIIKAPKATLSDRDMSNQYSLGLWLIQIPPSTKNTFHNLSVYHPTGCYKICAATIQIIQLAPLEFHQ